MGFVENIVNAMRPAADPAQPETKQDTKQEEKTENTTVGNEDSEPEGNTGESKTDEPKTYTEEELQKLIKEQRETWDSERLKTMSKDEQIRELETKLVKLDLRDKIYARLENENLPTTVSDLVQYSDEKGTMQSLENVVSIINKVANDALEQRLKAGAKPSFRTSLVDEKARFQNVSNNNRDAAFLKAFKEGMAKGRGGKF